MCLIQLFKKVTGTYECFAALLYNFESLENFEVYLRFILFDPGLRQDVSSHVNRDDIPQQTGEL